MNEFLRYVYKYYPDTKITMWLDSYNILHIRLNNRYAPMIEFTLDCLVFNLSYDTTELHIKQQVNMIINELNNAWLKTYMHRKENNNE